MQTGRGQHLAVGRPVQSVNLLGARVAHVKQLSGSNVPQGHMAVDVGDGQPPAGRIELELLGAPLKQHVEPPARSDVE